MAIWLAAELCRLCGMNKRVMCELNFTYELEAVLLLDEEGNGPDKLFFCMDCANKLLKQAHNEE